MRYAIRFEDGTFAVGKSGRVRRFATGYAADVARGRECALDKLMLASGATEPSQINARGWQHILRWRNAEIVDMQTERCEQ